MSLFTQSTAAQIAGIIFALVMPLGLIPPKTSLLKSISWPEGQDKKMTFTSLLSGSGRTEDGSAFSFWLVESSDGVRIEARTEKRRSPSRAQAVLKRTLRGAEIVERGPLRNNQQQRVGERVVACFPSKHQDNGRCVVLWTDGSDLHYLESSSLPHVLAFEKKYYPG